MRERGLGGGAPIDEEGRERLHQELLGRLPSAVFTVDDLARRWFGPTPLPECSRRVGRPVRIATEPNQRCDP